MDLPPNATYPGVYVAEAPSGLHRIAGAPTSIAAFVGWAARGPVDRAQEVGSFADFAHAYGGLDSRSFLGYAIRQFFDNGGRAAILVRVAAANAASASVTLDGKLNVLANSPGAWANDFAVEIRGHGDRPELFSLAVWHRLPDASIVPVERFDNLALTSDGSPIADDLLAGASAYVRATQLGGATDRPADTPALAPVMLAGGHDGDVLAPSTAAFEQQFPADGTAGVFGLLDKVDCVNLLAVPGESNPVVIARLQSYCRRRGAFFLVDCPEQATFAQMQTGPDPAIAGTDAANSALYFPWIAASDPLQNDEIRAFPPSGFVAGIYARTDTARGVWKAPAGTAANIAGAVGAAIKLGDQEQGMLNTRGINVIREFPVYGTVVWGARTLAGSDANASEWKYVPVRRFALFIEASLQRGTQWATFEPNGEALWSQVRLSVGTFLHELFRQGAFQGTSPRDAYFVKCDAGTTTPADIANGILNIVVGFAPLKPAEFVVITIRQWMGADWPPS